jgi:hypothetical protein
MSRKKWYSKIYTTFLCVGLVVGMFLLSFQKSVVASSGGFTINNTHTNASVIPQGYLDAARNLDILFVHASVGGEIRGGMDELATSNPTRYAFGRQNISGKSTSPHPPPATSLTWFQSNNGLGDGNTHYTHGTLPDQRMATFENIWMNPNTNFAGFRDHVDLALMKFCYVAVDETQYTGEYIWERYKAMMERLESQQNKKARYVWFTMPLRNSSGTEKSEARKRIHTFNSYVRSYAAGRGDIILFDIANIQSDNGRCVRNGYEALCSEYAKDTEGHLNTVGAKKVAEAFWYLFAKAVGWNDGSGSSTEPTPTIAFSDVPITHTYAKEIEYMKAKGISVGFNNGSEYRPDTTIDRKSLVTLVVKAKYSESEINSCIAANGYTGKNIFHDVPSTHHFAPFICMAKVNQIAIGYSTGYFGVDEPIKADAAIKIVMRTLDKNLEIVMNAPLPEYTKRLNDLGYYPPTVSKSNEQRHETTRGEFAYITQIIHDSYKRLDGSNVR